MGSGGGGGISFCTIKKFMEAVITALVQLVIVEGIICVFLLFFLFFFQFFFFFFFFVTFSPFFFFF